MTNITTIAHMLTGFTAAIAILLPEGFIITATLTYSFIKYQINEQRNIKDAAFQEIGEFMLGIGMATWIMVLE